MAHACADIEPLVPVYLDAELTGRDLHDVEAHITACRDCGALLRAELAFRRLVLVHAVAPAVPHRLRQRIAAALDAADRPERSVRWIAIAVAAATAIGTVVVVAVAVTGDRGPVRVLSQRFAVQSDGGGLARERRARFAPPPVIVLEHVAGRTRARRSDVDARALLDAAAADIGVPVELPGFPELVVTLRACQPALVNNLRAALFVFEVDSWEGRAEMALYVLDARALPAAVPRGRHVIELAGLPAVLHRNGRGIAYLFTGDMSLETLLRIAAGSGVAD